MKKSTRIIVSACLLGIPCRYNASAASKPLDETFAGEIRSRIIPVCPEQLSGFSTPRLPIEIENGFDGPDVLAGKAKVFRRDGKDVTVEMIHGAKVLYTLCKDFGASLFIAKDKSPSCGVKRIYDGHFSGTLKPGIGVCSAYLKSKGIEIVDMDSAYDLI